MESLLNYLACESTILDAQSARGLSHFSFKVQKGPILKVSQIMRRKTLIT